MISGSSGLSPISISGVEDQREIISGVREGKWICERGSSVFSLMDKWFGETCHLAIP